MQPTRSNPRLDRLGEAESSLVDIHDPEAGLSSIDAVVLCAVIVVIIAAGVATLQPKIQAAFKGIADAIP